MNFRGPVKVACLTRSSSCENCIAAMMQYLILKRMNVRVYVHVAYMLQSQFWANNSVHTQKVFHISNEIRYIDGTTCTCEYTTRICTVSSKMTTFSPVLFWDWEIEFRADILNTPSSKCTPQVASISCVTQLQVLPRILCTYVKTASSYPWHMNLRDYDSKVRTKQQTCGTGPWKTVRHMQKFALCEYVVNHQRWLFLILGIPNNRNLFAISENSHNPCSY